jgi:hypothetical protein
LFKRRTSFCEANNFYLKLHDSNHYFPSLIIGNRVKSFVTVLPIDQSLLINTQIKVKKTSDACPGMISQTRRRAQSSQKAWSMCARQLLHRAAVAFHYQKNDLFTRESPQIAYF